MSVTSVRINDDLDQLINQFAQENHRSKNWVINEAIRIFFEAKSIEQQRWEGIFRGLKDIEKGDVVDGGLVDAWLASWGPPHETDAP